MKKLSFIILLCFIVNFVYAQDQDKLLISLYKRLSAIGFELRIQKTGETYFKDFSIKQNSNKPEIVSAEKIAFLKKLVTKGHIRDWSFVPQYYRKVVKPINPNGKNAVEKWGSGYFTWAMSIEDWKNAASFYWKLPDSGDSCAFPVMWNKKPAIFGKQLYVLTYQLSTVKMSDKTFAKYFTASREWLNPENVSIEQLARQIKDGTKEEQQFAVRMLGRKKDAKGIKLIEKYLENDFSWEAQQVAFWAIGEIKKKKTIPFLIKSFYRKGVSESLIAETMCKIGGKQANKELKDWLNDSEMSKSKKQDIIYGIGKAKGVTIVTPFTKLPNDKLKEAINKAMITLQKK